MLLTLNSSHLNFYLDAPIGRWTLHPANAETPLIESARLSAQLRAGRTYLWHGDMRRARYKYAEAESRHGPLDTLRLDFTSRIEGVSFAVEAALPREHPFALLRFTVANRRRDPIQVDHVDLALVGPAFRGVRQSGEPIVGFLREILSERPDEEAAAGAIRLHPSPGDLAFFVNGWQSWSFSGALQAGQRQFRTRLGPIQRPQNLNPATPARSGAGNFASDMFGVLADRSHGRLLIVGFTSQTRQFGSVEVICDRLSPSLRLRAQCDGVGVPPGDDLTTDWAYFQLASLGEPDPLREYAEAVARENRARPPDRLPVGWCSWYHYFRGVTESDVTHNLAALTAAKERLPLSVVQLDDGFERAVGDWFDTNAKFPRGLGWVSDDIERAGFTPGLWLAPFILEHGAWLARDEPHWVLRNRFGLPVSAGWHWLKPSYGLDLTHPGAQEHVRNLITTAVREWGYPYLKLDFLYAAALPGRRRDPTLTRAQALRRGLEIIREAAGDETFLLGCGCPLGPGVGIFDAMRIGPDVDPHWLPTYRERTVFLAPEPAMPSTRNSIRNTLARLPLHRRWWLNDPDCLLVRETTKLTLDETLSLASVIALSGGPLILSDDMTCLDPERRAIVESLLPLVGKRAAAVDWLDKTMPELVVLPMNGAVGKWKVVGLFNWSDAAADRCLDLSAIGMDATRPHIVSDFWSARLGIAFGSHTYGVSEGQIIFPSVPPHGVRLLAVRPVTDEAQYVGSTLHFSQGAEIREWGLEIDGLHFVIDVGRVAEGAVWLRLPGKAGVATVDGRTAPMERDGEWWRLEVAVKNRADVTVRWR